MLSSYKKTQIKKRLKQCAVLNQVMEEQSFPKFGPDQEVSYYLIRAIVYQQISTKAADAIFGRFESLFTKKKISIRKLKRMNEAQLRSAGLSLQKTNYIFNIAEFFSIKAHQKIDWQDLNDDEIIKLLVQIKGVGVWTAQMVLIFALNRLNIFPFGDLAVRNAVCATYNVNPKDKHLKQKLMAISERWSPYKSVASKYMWGWIHLQRGY